MKLLALVVVTYVPNVPQEFVMLATAVPVHSNLQDVSLPEPIIWGVEPESTLTVKYFVSQVSAIPLTTIVVKVNVSLVYEVVGSTTIAESQAAVLTTP